MERHDDLDGGDRERSNHPSRSSVRTMGYPLEHVDRICRTTAHRTSTVCPPRNEPR